MGGCGRGGGGWGDITNLEASLFFSFLDLGLTAMGSSLTGVMSLMSRLSLSSSRPMLCSFRGFGVKSLPSPRLALPLQSHPVQHSIIVNIPFSIHSFPQSQQLPWLQRQQQQYCYYLSSSSSSSNNNSSSGGGGGIYNRNYD